MRSGWENATVKVPAAKRTSIAPKQFGAQIPVIRSANHIATAFPLSAFRRCTSFKPTATCSAVIAPNCPCLLSPAAAEEDEDDNEGIAGADAEEVEAEVVAGRAVSAAAAFLIRTTCLAKERVEFAKPQSHIGAPKFDPNLLEIVLAASAMMSSASELTGRDQSQDKRKRADPLSTSTCAYSSKSSDFSHCLTCSGERLIDS